MVSTCDGAASRSCGGRNWAEIGQRFGYSLRTPQVSASPWGSFFSRLAYAADAVSKAYALERPRDDARFLVRCSDFHLRSEPWWTTIGGQGGMNATYLAALKANGGGPSFRRPCGLALLSAEGDRVARPPRPKRRALPKGLVIGSRHAERSRCVERAIAIVTEQHAKLCFANASGVSQLAWNTGSSSPGELEMTRSTSAVAFSRSIASFSCFVRASSFSCRSATEALPWRAVVSALLSLALLSCHAAYPLIYGVWCEIVPPSAPWVDNLSLAQQ